MVNKTDGEDLLNTDLSLDNLDMLLEIPDEPTVQSTELSSNSQLEEAVQNSTNTDNSGNGTMFIPSDENITGDMRDEGDVSSETLDQDLTLNTTPNPTLDTISDDSSTVSDDLLQNQVENTEQNTEQNIEQNTVNIETDSEESIPKNNEASLESAFDISAIGAAINNIDADQVGDDKNNLVSFSYEKKEKKATQGYNYVKWSSILNSLIFLLIFIGIILGGYYAYAKYALKDDASERQKQYVEKMRGLRTTADQYISIDKTVNYNNTELTNGGLKTILDASDIGYIDKKYLLQDKINSLMTTLATVKNTFEENSKNVTKYAYLPKELSIILGENNTINSIEYSLLALEEIKFSSAVSVFRYLDSFTRDFSKSASISTKKIQENMKKIREKGGKDISIYLEKCYLNPFETNYNCNVIGDYNRYKRIRDNESDIDQNFFKKMMYYIDLKLERTELPSFNIVFQKFDKNSDKITFNIEINTQKEDELALTRAGILEDPVMFILEKLINNLKRSKFIRGNEINIPSVRIKSKKIKVGVTEFLVNTISRSFELPIQKDAEREIYDFVEFGI